MPRFTNFSVEIAAIGFDFSWDEQKVWVLDEPVTKMRVGDLEWHLDLPFFWENGGKYNLKPCEVLKNPELHQDEYKRIVEADLSFPIDVMEHKGRFVLLDGLHRLTRAAMLGVETINVRIIPRARIAEIQKD